MEKPKISREHKVELYNKLVNNFPKAILKGDTIPYTSLNGHMYSFLSKEDVLALRLPPAHRINFLEKYKTKLMEQYGIVQKEYVVVPNMLLEQTDELKAYLEISYNYVSSLRAKPNKKNKGV